MHIPLPAKRHRGSCDVTAVNSVHVFVFIYSLETELRASVHLLKEKKANSQIAKDTDKRTQNIHQHPLCCVSVLDVISVFCYYKSYFYNSVSHESSCITYSDNVSAHELGNSFFLKQSLEIAF